MLKPHLLLELNECCLLWIRHTRSSRAGQMRVYKRRAGEKYCTKVQAESISIDPGQAACTLVQFHAARCPSTMAPVGDVCRRIPIDSWVVANVEPDGAAGRPCTFDRTDHARHEPVRGHAAVRAAGGADQ